jgi:hypothetical protein
LAAAFAHCSRVAGVNSGSGWLMGVSVMAGLYGFTLHLTSFIIIDKEFNLT